MLLRLPRPILRRSARRDASRARPSNGSHARDGRNVRIELPSTLGGTDRFAAARQGDGGAATGRDLRAVDWRSSSPSRASPHHSGRESRNVSDPIGSGYIADLSRPGGNLTGLTLFEARHRRQVARDAQGASRRASYRAALHDRIPRPPHVRLLLTARPKRAAPIARSRSVASAGRERCGNRARHRHPSSQLPDSGDVHAPGPQCCADRDRYHCAGGSRIAVPAVYPERFTPLDGGLVLRDRRSTSSRSGSAASYVDRILRGEKLPIGAGTDQLFRPSSTSRRQRRSISACRPAFWCRRGIE